MKRFKNILLISDSENRDVNALKEALALSKNNKTRLTVAEVVEEFPQEMIDLSASIKIADLQEAVGKEAMKDLKAFVDGVKEKGRPVTTKILVGTAFLEIIRLVLAKKHGLVMITAEGKTELGEMFFGSTTMHLMRKCPCPIWVFNPKHPRRHAVILAAVDPDPFDEERDALNHRIMALASSMAEIKKAKLHVVHAWTPPTRNILVSRTLLEQEVEMMVSETEKAHRLRLDVLLKKYVPRIPEKQVHLLEGDAGEVIPELAKKLNVHLIVMGTVSRTGVSGLLIGNAAEKVLRQVDCSVLTAKPEGFVTPVEAAKV
ncbi:MAG: universal stress protein [bacterium]|nr:universal stress protein [bacterium]